MIDMASTPKILIVDDEPRELDSMKILLSSQGCEITVAGSGQEAMDIISGHYFDLVLLDMIMPDIDGLELMDYIKAQGNDDTTIIVISGHTSQEAAIGALKRGAYDYLKKPFEYEELIKTVQNALNQKKLESENRLINKKLALSEKRYRYLVQNSPDIIYTLDDKDNFTFINDAFNEMLGYDCKQLMENNFLTIVYEECLEKAKRFLNESKTCAYNASDIELKLKTYGKNAKYKSCEVRHMPIELESADICNISGKSSVKNNVKKCIGIHGLARDISDRKKLEAGLHHAQKMETVGTLAGGIAHDFNNLLMGIQGYASLALMKIDSQHPNYERLKNIDQYVQRGADLTKQLLGFARRGKYDVKPIDPNELIHNTAQMFGRTKKEIIIHEKYEKGVWSVEADEGQIEQVLLNLFLNAGHAMPEGGEILIETKNMLIGASFSRPFSFQHGPYVLISVTDNGIGMGEKTLQRIFDPFFTTKEMGHGSGLGLASVYGIIKNHSGFIDVNSKKGQGTNFTVYLPATQKKVIKKAHDSGKIMGGEETILLVDDEDMIIEVSSEILKALGYKVMSAKSGREALNIYRTNKNKIDLVMLDMIMPDMGGKESYDYLKKIDPEVKVLLQADTA